MDPGLDTPAEVRAAGPCRRTAHKALTYVTNATRKQLDIRVVIAGGWELYRYALDPLGPGRARLARAHQREHRRCGRSWPR